ncbi:MAG: hypothetical protein U5L06_16260 [Rhodovibrio sp.]|nr:hypothetical protein [Rhodovibrio sp.]
MFSVQIRQIRRREFGFLLLPGFSTLCLANSVEPLRAVNEIAGRRCYTHRLLSLDGCAGDELQRDRGEGRRAARRGRPPGRVLPGVQLRLSRRYRARS